MVLRWRDEDRLDDSVCWRLWFVSTKGLSVLRKMTSFLEASEFDFIFLFDGVFY